MSTDLCGAIECRPGARLWGPDDEDSPWQAAIDLWLLHVGNAYDALACLFGVRNSFGFRPLAEARGFPDDASTSLRADYEAHSRASNGVYSATWLSWSQLLATDWQETDASGAHSREQVAGDGTHWGPAWTVMRTLSALHGPAYVRLVVWFHA